jgi:hypothetical protein
MAKSDFNGDLVRVCRTSFTNISQMVAFAYHLLHRALRYNGYWRDLCRLQLRLRRMLSFRSSTTVVRKSSSSKDLDKSWT